MRGLLVTLSPCHQKGKRKCIEGFLFKFDSKGYRCHPYLSVGPEISLHSLRSALFYLDRANFFREDPGDQYLKNYLVESLGLVAQMMLATIIHSSYKHGNGNQVWRYCHDGSADRNSAEDLLSSYEP